MMNSIRKAVKPKGYSDGLIMVLLENYKNYCSEVTIPVKVEGHSYLVPEEIEINDSNIFNFPIVD